MDITSENSEFMQSVLLDVLNKATDGISEYDLITQLKQTLFSEFDNENIFNDTSKLYTIHFILFNTLYKLRIKLNAQRKNHLDINPICIRLLPYNEQHDKTLTQPDKLSLYYLDTDNLTNTSQKDIDDMLGLFWVKFMNPESKQNAMEILGVSEPFDRKTIKSSYRKLVMQYHPDRGGDNERIQEINNAMEILKRYL